MMPGKSSQASRFCNLPPLGSVNRLINTNETCYYVNTSVRTLRREIKAGRLAFKRVRGRLKFDPRDVEAYLRNRAVFADSRKRGRRELSARRSRAGQQRKPDNLKEGASEK
jgi:excisionase family DNA binding protein